MSEKVLILGLSKSGIAAAKFAASKGYDVYITESKGVNDIRAVSYTHLTLPTKLEV